MAKFIPVEPFSIVIFGATGDLARRKLIPALFRRFLDGQIDPSSQIIGVARSDWQDDEFLAAAKESCRAKVTSWPEEEWQHFCKLLRYFALDATDNDADWSGLLAHLPAQDDRPRIFYLATTPLIFVSICEALGRHGLNKPSDRVVLEKPLGTDLQSARKINKGVGKVFDERNIYRIDHYLGKETVQNLLVLRFDNILFDQIWSRGAIDHVQITVAEDLGLEGRADYYDRSGAMRDMVQNHLLQLLCLVAMEPPNSLDADDVRMEKVKVLRVLRKISGEKLAENVIFGQYEAGMLNGEKIASYQETLSEEKRGSNTETFVAIKAAVDNGRWSGVPFFLRTGKRLAERKTEIVIAFKQTPHMLFDENARQPNRLVLRLQPDEGVRLFIQIKEPGPGGLRIKSLPLNLSYAENFEVQYPDAYDRLLMDIVRGNLSLFIRREEVEAAWSWIDHLLLGWQAQGQPSHSYKPGSNGPDASQQLLGETGRDWWGG